MLVHFALLSIACLASPSYQDVHLGPLPPDLHLHGGLLATFHVPDSTKGDYLAWDATYHNPPEQGGGEVVITWELSGLNFATTTTESKHSVPYAVTSIAALNYDSLAICGKTRAGATVIDKVTLKHPVAATVAIGSAPAGPFTRILIGGRVAGMRNVISQSIVGQDMVRICWNDETSDNAIYVIFWDSNHVYHIDLPYGSKRFEFALDSLIPAGEPPSIFTEQLFSQFNITSAFRLIPGTDIELSPLVGLHYSLESPRGGGRLSYLHFYDADEDGDLDAAWLVDTGHQVWGDLFGTDYGHTKPYSGMPETW